MNRKLDVTLLIFFILGLTQVNAQSIKVKEPQVVERERPARWEELVLGGCFMDRFQPMPNLGGMTNNTWGAANVIPREVNNGIEDKNWSYWGGNTRLMDDGKYHLFVCRWPETAPLGHMSWKKSTVVHTIADNSFGPYKVLEEIGSGHNPEWYISKTGKFIIYVIDGYYKADSIDGPWTYKKFEFDLRDRYRESKPPNYLHNLTFAQREDGSYLMVNRKGDIWFSKDGISRWNRVTDKRVYPPVEGRYEDPYVWKTNVQYHLIVNDWLGRIAWHLRSKDGFEWKVDPGEAYMPGHISKNIGGQHEDWFKYERIKMVQDEYGRAFQANFAVIDTLKHYDLPNDNHNSKLITVPMTKGRLLSVLNKKPITSKTKKIRVKVKAEKGFNPHTDMDMQSLRFGASEEVNFGRGSKIAETEEDGKDLIVSFDGLGNGLTESNFAGKLIGKTKDGKLLFGYSKIPGVKYIEEILSTRLPQFTKEGEGYVINIEVENFGQVVSETAILKVIAKFNGEDKLIAKGKIPEIKPFEKSNIKLRCKDIFESGKTHEVSTVIESMDRKPIVFTNVIKLN